MAIIKGAKIAKRVITLLIILAVIIVGYKFLTNEPGIKPITENIIKLRITENPLDKAKIISSTDNMITKLESDEVKERWNQLTKCLNKECSDTQYFNFLIILFSQYPEKLAKTDLLLKILAIQRYWGTEEVVEFSKAMSYVDEEIQKMPSNTVKKKWQNVIDCNNLCDKKNDYFLELIQSVLN